MKLRRANFLRAVSNGSLINICRPISLRRKRIFPRRLFPDFHAQQPREFHGLHGRNDRAL